MIFSASAGVIGVSASAKVLLTGAAANANEMCFICASSVLRLSLSRSSTERMAAREPS